VTGGALWHDYQAPNADRLTLAFALAAARQGAAVANYVEALAPAIERRRVTGVRARDRLSGREFDIEASVVLNAAGAGAVPFMAAMGVPRPVPLLKAMNVVTSRPAPPLALGSPTRDGRLLFLVPWRGAAVAGTSHSQALVRPGETAVSGAELDAFLAEVNEAFPRLALGRADVTLVHRGLVPAVRDRTGRLALQPHTFFRDHAADGLENAVTVIGVKYTTGRGVAERAVDLVASKLGRPGLASRTRETPLPGALQDRDAPEALEPARRWLRSPADAAALAARGEAPVRRPDVAAHLVESYGTEAEAVLALGGEDPAWLDPVGEGEPVLLAEIVHAVRHEMACRLSDVVLRRTPLGSARYPGDEPVRRAGEVMARELGWDAGRLAGEIRAVREFYDPVEI
jgi:glycerol-3-phosphate dehydrogenase